MALIIDSHVHVLPDPRGWGDRSRSIRKIATEMALPWSRGFHHAQPWVRVLPGALRTPVEWAGSAWTATSLALHGYVSDLRDTLDAGKIDRAVVIAHPPTTSNEFVLELAKEDRRLVPVVSVAGVADAATELPALVELGARALKIHAAADGQGPDHAPYLAALEAARALSLPVILHTGCLHGPFYRKPEFGRAEAFEPWFQRFPEVQFILAHMNMHEPRVAIDLAERYPNLHLETSWQPMETISEAVRCVGPGRVLFGSDWPLGGQNIPVGLNRIEDCLETGTLRIEDAQLILGKNAMKLFKIEESS